MTAHQPKINPQRQIFLLFTVTMLMFMVGSGVMSLIALYAKDLGGTPSQIGLSLAVSFAALSVSTLSTGWLTQRLNNRKGLILMAAGLSVPVSYGVSQVSNIWQMTVGVSLLWFLFGIVTTTTTILTGLNADKNRRGMMFGIIGAALPMGKFIGALFVGPIVDRWGYPAMFMAAVVVYLGVVGVACLIRDVKITPPVSSKRASQTIIKQSGDTALILLMVASVLAFSISFMTNMARPLLMENLSFSATDISSVSAVSGLIVLPLPLIVGWLSDKLGRPSMLIAIYLLPMIGLALMLPAAALWQFWVAQSLISVVNITQTVGSALITDITPQAKLSGGLARYNATVWIGAVFGFISTGLLIDVVGLIATLGIGIGVLALAIICALLAVRHQVASTQVEAAKIPA